MPTMSRRYWKLEHAPTTWWQHAPILPRQRRANPSAQDNALGTRPPRHSVEDVKKSSSKWMKAEGGVPGFSWQAGYGAFSIGESQADTVIHYI